MAVAAIALLDAPGAGQQPPPVPQTGAPRHLWPQRPGTSQPLIVDSAGPRARLPVVEPAQASEPGFVPDEVLVQFEPDVAAAERETVRNAIGAVLLRTGGPDGRLERLATQTPVGDAVAILSGMAAVDFAEPNWIVRADAVADDTYFLDGSLWGMYGDLSAPANPFGSQAAETWAQGFTGSSDVYVAVLDEGIDVSHPDLAPNIWVNPFDPVDGVDNDGNGRVDDRHGWDFRHDDASVYDGGPWNLAIDSHGTHVAGTVGARGGNGFGVAGIVWNVRIISAKFLDESGNGNSADAAEAIDYLVDLKARHGLNIVAVNNSWGGSAYSETFYRAIVRAADAGILIVASAGNSGWDNDVLPHYPSNYSTLSAVGYEAVVSVAALTNDGRRPSFSNFGATTVDVAGPGDGILSTLPGGTFGSMSGTSMAAPHVTGAVALYKAMHPAATASQIRSAILTQGAPTASMAGITATGRRLDVSTFHRFSLSIDGPTMNEGDAGTTGAVFTVSLSEPSANAITVDYTTVDVTAFSGPTEGPGVSIPAGGRAAPFPSQISIPHGTGRVTTVEVLIGGFTHEFTQDVDVLLVGPGGQTCVLMADVAGNAFYTTLRFADGSAPLNPSVSGTYRPTSNGGAALGAPAPPGPYGGSLSVFSGQPAEGPWRLFVFDDADVDEHGGSIAWWSLVLTTTAPDFVATSGTVVFAPNSTAQTLTVPVLGDTAFEPAETFKVVLGDASGANVVDGEAVATIRNDDFTDLSLSGLPIKAVHILELRAGINEARVAKGLAAYNFEDPGLTAGTMIRAVHFTQLRTALTDAYVAAGMPVPVFTDHQVTPGVTTIKAAHITEIRAALLALP